MKYIYRILALGFYPLLLSACLFYLFKKKQYNNTIKNHYKTVVFNTLIYGFLFTAALYVFFRFEDTIYVYDYAGHWTRALELKQFLYNNPLRIFTELYSSMNNNDYSYLPALCNLPFVFVNESFCFFCISNLWLFSVPTVFVLNVLYFTYFNSNRYLPLIISLTVFPLYLTLFYGKVDCCGLLFITIIYALAILQDFDSISFADCAVINGCCFMAIFLRRWYLYSVVVFYLSFLIRWLFTSRKIKDLIKIFCSGILMLMVIVLFFNTFLGNVLNNNFSEAYEVYNNPGKVLSFINNISPLVLIICGCGAFTMAKKNLPLLIICIVSIIVPCTMIWPIQSFEFHHYYIFILNILIMFSYGLAFLLKFSKPLIIGVSALMLIQPFIIFSYTGNTLPLFSNIRKNPEVLDCKQQITDLASYISRIEDGNFTCFVASGSYGILTNDLLKNALLPELSSLSVEPAVFDLRDGFPKDFQYIRYIVVTDPVLYTDKEYQHMFDIITEAVTTDSKISQVYDKIYETEIKKHKVSIYELTGTITPEMKKHFYDEMLRYYPDKADYFSYILN